MIVTFISQCEKNALKKTRRVLDAFADRIGDNAWQTVITQEGLQAVRKLLRKTASKSTAVSCHQVKTRSRTELLWVVGRRTAFDAQGRVPVNTTRVNRALRDDADDWLYLPHIQALSALAALLHDWGKATKRFQSKLLADKAGPQGDALRHEYISCLLILSLFPAQQEAGGVGDKTDEQWLGALAEGRIADRSISFNSNDKLFEKLPMLARLVLWLVLSHHRLPLSTKSTVTKAPSQDDMLCLIDESWGYFNELAASNLPDCIQLHSDAMLSAKKWLKEVKRWANKLLSMRGQFVQLEQQGCLRLLLHHCRLSLMLADHSYSKLEGASNWQGQQNLIANTKSKELKHGRGFARSNKPNQYLDEHLLGVCEFSKKNTRILPIIEKRLLQSKETQQLKKRSPKGYEWQDKAVRTIKNWLEDNAEPEALGTFIVNMASTGAGKTFANAKIMRSLSSDGDSLRYTLALGLRTLTLQTGDEYRDKIFNKVDGSDLAVIIGSRAIQELHQNVKRHDQSEDLEEQLGSESARPLIPSSDEVIYDGELSEDNLAAILKGDKDQALLHAPVLACTIDHLMPAVTSKRGGRYILPALRLMSSDLVIDEIDDFTGDDSKAIAWLIHLAGMLGRKVMISSATISPSIAQGYFKAYRSGWQLFSKMRAKHERVTSIWVDEFNTQIESVYDSDDTKAIEQYLGCHNSYVAKRCQQLAKQAPRRLPDILDCQHLLSESHSESSQEQTPVDTFQAYSSGIKDMALRLHDDNHYLDEDSGIAISFGVVRMANITPALALTRYLLDCELEGDVCMRVMPYHSQQVMLLRNAQEQHLDQVLKRKEKQGQRPKAINNNLIAKQLKAAKKQGSKHLLFILVATPVEEVGRDHDFDWAIIEPSSYRSMVQMAGRIKRHRFSAQSHINIAILQYNWKALRMGDKEGVYFLRPGYETGETISNQAPSRRARVRSSALKLPTHDIKQLLAMRQLSERFDAVERISSELAVSELAKFEHKAIAHVLCNDASCSPETVHGYLTQYWYLTALCQDKVKFRRSEPSVQLFLLARDGTSFFVEKNDEGLLIRAGEDIANREKHHHIERYKLSEQQLNRLWLERDYSLLIEEQAQQRDISNAQASLRYGELTMRDGTESDNAKWLYCDHLGLFKELK